jgi:hypothetical protein
MWSIECSLQKLQRGKETDRERSTDHEPPLLRFELDGIEGSLQEVYLTSVASDHQLAIGPRRINEFEGRFFRSRRDKKRTRTIQT